MGGAEISVCVKVFFFYQSLAKSTGKTSNNNNVKKKLAKIVKSKIFYFDKFVR